MFFNCDCHVNQKIIPTRTANNIYNRLYKNNKCKMYFVVMIITCYLFDLFRMVNIQLRKNSKVSDYVHTIRSTIVQRYTVMVIYFPQQLRIFLLVIH